MRILGLALLAIAALKGYRIFATLQSEIRNAKPWREAMGKVGTEQFAMLLAFVLVGAPISLAARDRKSVV